MSAAFTLLDWGPNPECGLQRPYRYVISDARGNSVAAFIRPEDATRCMEWLEPGSSKRGKAYPITRKAKGAAWRITTVEEPKHGEQYQGVRVDRESEEEVHGPTVTYEQASALGTVAHFFDDEGRSVYMDDYDFLEELK